MLVSFAHSTGDRGAEVTYNGDNRLIKHAIVAGATMSSTYDGKGNLVKKSLLLFLLALALVAALATGSCESSKKQNESTPTESVVPSATPATCQDDTDSVITQQLQDYECEAVTIDEKACYVGSSGTSWIKFDAHLAQALCPLGQRTGPIEPVTGILKMPPDEGWELDNLGVGDVQCGIPSEVQTGLGFEVCPASEERLDQAIKDWLISGPALGIQESKLKISREALYTDASGTDWAEFCLLPIPNVSSSTYGFMKKVAGANWQGVNFGSAFVECHLPANVQSGLGFPNPDCPPGS